MTDDERWMGVALEAATRGIGRTTPNPAVGAVIVRDGVSMAEGWTQPPGQPHAEPHALAAAGPRAVGATLYVTQEPCCHWGRTPPCTDAILASGVRRVVIGMIDPFPLVAGRGVALLRAAGIEVVVGVRERDCQRSNLGWVRVVQGGLPEVTLKAAVSLDGRIAAEDGQSRWITGALARASGHALRDRHDAVLVGIGTVLADDPALTTRIPGGRDAVPVVLDTELRIPDGARLLSARPSSQPTPIVVCAEDAPERTLPAEIVRVPRAAAGVDVRAALARLGVKGLHRVLVEGGGRVARSLLDADAVDRIEMYLNPRVLAGGPGWAAGPGYGLSSAPAFRFERTERLGPDLHLTLERGEES